MIMLASDVSAIGHRPLGRSGLSAGSIGLGCWAIGGFFTLDGKADGWGEVDDEQSIRAIHVGLDMGASLIDTADAYGTGHSEEVIGRALKGRRGEAIVATKFGYTYDRAKRALIGTDVSPSYIEQACTASLQRLGTGHIDLYQIHVGELSHDQADAASETLEKLAETGAIRFWGWSTDNAAGAKRMVKFPHFVAVQQELNVFTNGPDMLAMCESTDLASLNRSPLAMGFLTGKFNPDTRLPDDDVRAAVTAGCGSSRTDGRVPTISGALKSSGSFSRRAAEPWLKARWVGFSPVRPAPSPYPVSSRRRRSGRISRRCSWGHCRPQ